MLSAICSTAAKRLKNDPCLDLVACCAMQMTPDVRMTINSIVDRIFETDTRITDNILQNSMLYRVIRMLRTDNSVLLNRYWDEVTKQIEMDHFANSTMPTAPKSYLHQMIHNYSFFNNNMSGTYRHMHFEQVIMRIIMHDLQHGMSAYLPFRMAQYTSFVIAYGASLPEYKEIPNFIVDKIENMADQFSVYDCWRLSKGLSIFYQMRHSINTRNDVVNKIYRIQNVLDHCLERHIESPSLTFANLLIVWRSFNDRRCMSFDLNNFLFIEY